MSDARGARAARRSCSRASARAAGCTHRPAELSGGEQQRTAVARALAVDRRCILADEPSGNLDHRNAERLHELFAELARDLEVGLVVVTHNRSLAARAHRVLSTRRRAPGPTDAREGVALMLCDNCKERDSVVKLVQIVEGTPSSSSTCASSAPPKRGVEIDVSPPKHPLGDFLQKVQQQQVMGGGSAPATRGTRSAAPSARRPAPISARRGRLGCAQCYGAFEPSLRDLLRRVHGSARHIGPHVRAAAARRARARRDASASSATGSSGRSRASNSSWRRTSATGSGAE